jgi:hypothetical protein
MDYLDNREKPLNMTDEEFSVKVSEILSQLILEVNCLTEADREAHTAEILESYNHNFEYYKGPPDLQEIVSDIFETNWEFMLEIGYLDYYYGTGKTESLRSLIELEDDEKDEGDYAAELADLWFEDYAFGASNNLDSYIKDILDSKHMCYKNSDSVVGAYLKHFKYKIYFNDCQNLLIPEWNLDMYSSVGIVSSNSQSRKKLMSMYVDYEESGEKSGQYSS